MTACIGIDVGSAAVKVVALVQGRPAAWLEEPTRPAVAAQSSALIAEVRRRAGLAPDLPVRLRATGYGRNLVSDADARVSEIMANAAGAVWLAEHWGELERMFGIPPTPARVEGRFRTIVDVGGQDSKVIALDPDGMIRDFSMNDRCAAGTGRFLEVMAKALELEVQQLGEISLQAKERHQVSSTCTVFAESEVVTLVAEPDDGYEFARWTGDVDTITDVNDASTTINMISDYYICAHFREAPVVCYPDS